MRRLKLVLPTKQYKYEVMSYKREFIENGDSLHGTAGLGNIETFEEWHSFVLDNLKEETVREGLVPASTYMAISTDNGRLIGMIDIRHRLNDYLLSYGGHIGYSVRKSERQKGYATEMLELALQECAKLENELQEGKTIIQRYWITLN